MLPMGAGDILEGRYRLLEHLGTGGMGTVFVAERLSLGDRVAVKVVTDGPNFEQARVRFAREARLSASLHHPNVVSVLDFSDGEQPFLVMELVEGTTVEEELKSRGKFAPSRALRIFGDVCSAVSAGHRLGIIHRDLKPSNIMLARYPDGREVVKILDFGIARLLNNEGLLRDHVGLTETGTLLGTYQYMAPEQLQGLPASVASDVFALAVILYEMIAASSPFSGPNAGAVLVSIARGNFVRLDEAAPGVDPALAKAVHAAFSVDPESRPPSAEAFARMAGAPRLSAPPPSRQPSSDRTDTRTGFSEVEKLAERFRASHADTSIAQRETPDLPSFVGRSRPLDTLRVELGAARSGRGRFILISGEAGIGKSQLLSALLDEAAARLNVCICRGRFFDYEGSQPPPFAVFFEMLGRHKSPSFRSLPLVSVDDSGVPSQRWREFQSIADEFLALSAGKMLILAFDDWQWATTSDFELILHLSRALSELGVFVIGTARSSPLGLRDSSVGLNVRTREFDRFTASLIQQHALSIVDVEPFSEADLRAFFDAFGEVRMRPVELRRIARTTAGNPHFLHELTRHLIVTGKIHREGRGWVCEPLDDVELPATLMSLVRARVSALSDATRAVLEVASVLGDELRFETLVEACEMPEEVVEVEVDRLLRRRLLRDARAQDERATSTDLSNDLRFSSELIRRVVYEDLPSRKRRRIHRRVVDALHVRYANSLRRVARVLCWHAAAVLDDAETLTQGLLAAEDDLACHDVDRAEGSLRRARAALSRLEGEGRVIPDQHAMLLLLEGRLDSRLGHSDRAKRALEQVLAIAGISTAQRIDALVELAQTTLGLGSHDEALRAVDQALMLSNQINDQRKSLEAGILRSQVLSRSARGQEARALLESLLAELMPNKYPSLRAHALRALAWEHVKRGEFAAGTEKGAQALDLATKARDPLAEHAAVAVIAASYSEAGDSDNAIPFHQRALELARAMSMRRREAIDLANLAEAHNQRNESTVARQKFGEALAIFVEIGDRACEGDCRVNLGRTYLAERRIREALTMLVAGQRLCDECGRVEYGAIARLHLGEGLLAEGDPRGAVFVLEEAREMFASQGLHQEWEAETLLARCLSDRPAIALGHVDRACELLSALISALPEGARAERLLRRLGEVETLRTSLEKRRD